MTNSVDTNNTNACTDEPDRHHDDICSATTLISSSNNDSSFTILGKYLAKFTYAYIAS